MNDSLLPPRTKKDRLVREATDLKKASLLAAALLGNAIMRYSYTEWQLPDYALYGKHDLLKEQDNLLSFLDKLCRELLMSPTPAHITNTMKWLTRYYDVWQQAGGATITLCTAHDFETECGLLRHRECIEVPPYAELLLQDRHGMAIRHPEYHLARDLELSYNMFLDAEQLLADVDWNNAPQWAACASENAQGLGRSTIQHCFNLLEAFTSGLARSYVMQHKGMAERTKEKLLDNRKTLEDRLLAVSAAVCPKPTGLSLDTPPLKRLFGTTKQQRNAFVHCEPGPQLSRHNYVKEHAFHNIDKSVVHNAVTDTIDITRIVWNAKEGRHGPRWLHDLGENDRFPGEHLRLVPPNRQAASPAEGDAA